MDCDGLLRPGQVQARPAHGWSRPGPLCSYHGPLSGSRPGPAAAARGARRAGQPQAPPVDSAGRAGQPQAPPVNSARLASSLGLHHSLVNNVLHIPRIRLVLEL